MEGLFKLIRRGLVKIPQPHVTDVIIQFTLGDTTYLDDIAGHGKILRRVEVFPHDSDGDWCAFGTTHLPHSVDECDVFRRLPIDLEDAITGFEPRPVRWGTLDRGHHGQLIIPN